MDACIQCVSRLIVLNIIFYDGVSLKKGDSDENSYGSFFEISNWRCAEDHCFPQSVSGGGIPVQVFAAF